MRLLNNIITILCCFGTFAGATEWTVKGANSEFDMATGCGRLGGPVSFSSEEWTFTASREMIIRAKPRIVRKSLKGAERSYKLDTSPARIVFFGQCEAKNREGLLLLQAPFMIFDVEQGRIIGEGSSVSFRDKNGEMKPLEPGLKVSIDLDSGEVILDKIPEPQKK